MYEYAKKVTNKDLLKNNDKAEEDDIIFILDDMLNPWIYICKFPLFIRTCIGINSAGSLWNNEKSTQMYAYRINLEQITYVSMSARWHGAEHA